jgi:hypothetical protein
MAKLSITFDDQGQEPEGGGKVFKGTASLEFNISLEKVESFFKRINSADVIHRIIEALEPKEAGEEPP